MKELVGHIVREVKLCPDKRILTFITEGFEIVYEAEGDCCTGCWIESMDNVEAVIDQRILETDSRSLPNCTPDANDGYQLDIYCYEVKTSKGVLEIVFRASHNGYYGGSLIFKSIKSIKDGVKYVPMA